MFGIPPAQISATLLHAVRSLVENPLLYAGIILMIWDLRKSAQSQRRFFGVRVTRVWRTLASQWGVGVLIGILLSVGLAVLGVHVASWELWTVTLTALAFAVIRVRYMGVALPVVLMTALTALAHVWQPGSSSPQIKMVWQHLKSFHLQGWLAIVAASFLAQAIVLIMLSRTSNAPAALTSRRGRTIGAFVVQLGLLTPVFVITSGSLTLPAGIPSWWPVLGYVGKGVGFEALPLVVGFSGLLAVSEPKRVARQVSGLSLVAGLAMAGDVVLVQRYGLAMSAFGVLFCLLGVELPRWMIQRRESGREPAYTASPNGVRILSVVHGSLAQTVGLRTGEVITHVNQVPVHSEYDLHFAFEQNPAYAKLTVRDEKGVPRIVGKPVYMGERVNLGLIVVPEPNFGGGYGAARYGLFETLYLRRPQRPVTTTPPTPIQTGMEIPIDS